MINSRTLAYTALSLLEKKDAEKYIDAFLTYLTEKNLTGLLAQMLEHITRLQSESSLNETLHISSRYELSDNEITEIKKITDALDAQVQTHIDDAVIGGFSATYKCHIYDGSLANGLTRLKGTLMQ